jgi:PAS domain S-box-containing protein
MPCRCPQQQSRLSSLGFLIFSPVYVQNTGVLRGFVSGVFDIDVLVQSSLLSNQSNDIDIALIDESHDPLIPILNGTIDDGIFEERDLARPVSDESVGEIVLPNRVWKLVIGKSDGAFERSTWLWAVPLLGIITSIAIATSILAIERRRQVSEAFNLELEAVSDDLARLIDTANAPIFGADINGKINEWNANIAATTGYSRDDVIGRDLVDALIPEENQSQVRAVLEAALVGEQTENYESPVVTSDGRTLQILLNSTTRRNGQGEIIGAVGVGQDVTERVRTEIERNRLFTEKADLIRRLLETQEEERAAIAYDLHDGPAQQLSGASMFIESYIAVKDEIDIVESDSIISKAKDSVGFALEEIQRIMAGLRPSSLDDLGLVQSLRESANEVSRRTGHSIEFITQLDERTRFDETIEIVLYRIAQEAVNNAVKHAGGGRVSVELVDRDGVLVLKVKDSGAGFDVDLMMTSPDKRGMGLVGMRERAAMIGAGLTVTSRAGDGTLVTVELVSSTHGEFKHV